MQHVCERFPPAGIVLAVLVIATSSAGQEKEELKREKVRVGPVTYQIPADWRRERPRSEMRALQYAIPLAKRDEGKAELVVFYFGGQGGSVKDNLKRWREMFEDTKDEGTVESFEVGALKITTLDISGTYRDRPAPLADQVTLRKDYRMLNAVVETPEDGPYFFRMVGPKKSISAQVDNWKHLLKTAHIGN